MPIRQGSIDHLCGVYSVLNATEIVVGKYAAVDRQLKDKCSQRKTLFNDLIGCLAKNNELEEALTAGIYDIDASGLIDVAVKSVKKYQKIKMRKQPAFDTDIVPLDGYWERLTEHLGQADSAAIVCLTGHREHWTCVKEITPDILILADSNGMKHINKHQCMVEIEEKGFYSLWPSMTYLLSVGGKNR